MNKSDTNNRKDKKSVNSTILWRKLIEHMNEGLWMGDKNEKTIYANPKFCKLMGYTLPEMLGRESYDFWDKESGERVRSVNKTKRVKGIASSYEGNLLTKSKKKIPVMLSGAPLPNGGTIGILTDLTELKQKEKAEKVLNSAIQYAADAIIVVNKKGEITSWNRGAKITFGYKNEEIIGRPLSILFPETNINEILQNPKIMHNLEMQGQHKIKKPVTISTTFTPIYDDGEKQITSFLLIARDITNQAKFEEELTLKYDKMMEAYNRFGLIRRQMDYIFEILDLCNESCNPKNIADYIVSSIIMLTCVDACILRIYNKEKDTLELVSSLGVGNEWSGKASIKYKNSLAEKSFNKNAPLKIVDLIREPKYQSKYLAKKNNFSSLLLIPLREKRNGEIKGSLSLYASPDKKLEIFENKFMEQYAKLIEVIVELMF